MHKGLGARNLEREIPEIQPADEQGEMHSKECGNRRLCGDRRVQVPDDRQEGIIEMALTLPVKSSEQESRIEGKV